MSKVQKKEEKEINIIPKKNFSLRLTKQELLHLRDLFGVLLPSSMKSTISQSLAANQGRHLIESKLWNKISNLCLSADIPMGEEAPDFVATIVAPPDIGVVEMFVEDDGGMEEVNSGFEQEEEK